MSSIAITRSPRTRDRSSARTRYESTSTMSPTTASGAEHVHLDVEAEHVELVRETLDPAAVPEADARTFVERKNDVHDPPLHHVPGDDVVFFDVDARDAARPAAR